MILRSSREYLRFCVCEKVERQCVGCLMFVVEPNYVMELSGGAVAGWGEIIYATKLEAPLSNHKSKQTAEWPDQEEISQGKTATKCFMLRPSLVTAA